MKFNNVGCAGRTRPAVRITAAEGGATAGEKLMEFYADEEALREPVLSVFCVPVGG